MKTAAGLAVLVLLDISLAVGAGVGISRAQPSLEQAVGTTITREAYEGRARARASAPAYAPTYSAYLSPVAFTALEQSSNLAVTAGHPVWVVTVHTFHHCADCAAELPTAGNWVYSVVYDSQSGQEIDYCSGCALLSVSRYDTVGERALTATPAWVREATAKRFWLR